MPARARDWVKVSVDFLHGRVRNNMKMLSEKCEKVVLAQTPASTKCAFIAFTNICEC